MADLEMLRIVERLEPDAYGVPIRQALEQTPRPWWKFWGASYGEVYTRLDTLEDEGLVVSFWGEATPERGNWRKMYFTLTDWGRNVLAKTLVEG